MPAVGYSHLAGSVLAQTTEQMSLRRSDRRRWVGALISRWLSTCTFSSRCTCSATASTSPRAFDKSEGVVQAGVHGLYTALCPTAHCWRTINLIMACRWCSCWSCSACWSIVWRQVVSWGFWAVYFICKHGKTNKEGHQWKNREGLDQRSRYN